MSYSRNLIYNGDFSQGTDSWSGTNISISNGEVTLKGDLSQDIYIPVASNRRYKLTYDLKVLTKDSNSFYIALWPYDNMRQSINVSHANKAIASAQITLASALANGDTTVTLTSGTNWPTSRTYQRIGICNKLAWGYKRCTYSQPYQSISGNIITLKTAWNGGSWAAGTKVAEFEDGGTYFYPHYLGNAALPTNWTTYTAEFNGGDSIRNTCQYIRFTTLGYTHTYQMRNIKLECISDEQYCPYEKSDISITKQGEIFANRFNEVGTKIRYVRDTTSGSTANTANHWCEFKVINSVGENIVWGRDVKNESGTIYSNPKCTDGIVDSGYTDLGSGTHSIIFDLGYTDNIEKIQIWHYYPDSRTYYNNITEVSADGTNWYTVYSGEKPETSAGNTIYLNPHQVQFFKAGTISAKNIYEI